MKRKWQLVAAAAALFAGAATVQAQDTRMYVFSSGALTIGIPPVCWLAQATSIACSNFTVKTAAFRGSSQDRDVRARPRHVPPA